MRIISTAMLVGAIALAASLLSLVGSAAATSLLPLTTITTAVTTTTGTVFQFRTPDRRQLNAQAKLTYGSGGTSIDVYLQTSFDGGTSWADVCNFHMTTAAFWKVVNLSATTPVTTAVTPTDGSMAANTCQDGLIGPQLRVKWASSGTYGGGTTLQVDVNGGSMIVKAQ